MKIENFEHFKERLRIVGRGTVAFEYVKFDFIQFPLRGGLTLAGEFYGRVVSRSGSIVFLHIPQVLPLNQWHRGSELFTADIFCQWIRWYSTLFPGPKRLPVLLSVTALLYRRLTNQNNFSQFYYRTANWNWQDNVPVDW